MSYLPSSEDLALSSLPTAHKEDKTLERWCHALKLEKLASILRFVYANSDCSDRLTGISAST